MAIDEAKLEAFMGKVVTELGARKKPDHISGRGMARRCASQLSPKPPWQKIAMRSRLEDSIR